MGNEVEPIRVPEDQQPDALLPDVIVLPHRRFGRTKKWVSGTTLTGMVALGGGGYWASEHPDKAAEISRNLIGDEKTAWLEGKVLAVKDKKDQWKYDHFGGRENPFEENNTVVNNPLTPEPQGQEITIPTYDELFIFAPPEIPKPKPMVLPETYTILSAEEREAVWTIDGLPHTSP